MADATIPRAAPKAVDDHPSGDNRFKMLDATMKRHRFAQESLIEVLHTAQELFGYLKPDMLLLHRAAPQAAAEPRLRRGDVLSFFHLLAPGRAYLRGLHRNGLLRQGVGPHPRGGRGAPGTIAGRTTADGRVSLGTARCLGACGLAPVVVYDGEVAGKQSRSRRSSI